MTRTNDVGLCEHCNHHFHYYLVHNGFGDTAYSYCESCGTTALLSGWFEHIPKNACLRVHGPISRAIESLLTPCECRGAFKSESAPRCPKCKNILSAQAARPWIEANAPGTARGWRWQDSWAGVYCIVIEDRVVNDNWL